MSTSYDPDAAVEYARLFWDKACSDGFTCLKKADVSRCTGKPKGDPYVAVASGTKFQITEGPPPTEEVVTPLGNLRTDCLDDATHFVSCCIGTPPGHGPAARGGGLRLPSSPRFPKAPYGATDALTLVSLLEKGPGVRALVKKSSKRELPAGVRKGDVIVYSRDGRYTHAAIFVTGADIATHSVSRSPESPVLSSAWDYLADDTAFRWSIYQLPVPVGKFAVAVGPFPAKLVLDFDAKASATLQKQVKTTGDNTAAAAKAIPAMCADTLAASLIDLTAGPVEPPHGGFFDDQTYYIGSMAKLFAMYAAFELRSRVRRIAEDAIAAGLDSTKSGWEKPVISAIEDAWKAPVAAAFRGFDTSFPAQFPKLSAIFDFSSSTPADRVPFRKGTATPDQVDDIGSNGKRPTAQMAFREWLDLAISWSNNYAADLVITKLGYPYINGVLSKAGFQSDSSPITGPLFISGSYRGNDWKPGKELGQLTPRGEKHYQKTTNFVGSALEVARMLAALALHRAFGGDVAGKFGDVAGKRDCIEMLKMMRHGPGVTGDTSFIQEALHLPDAISGKIGIGDPPPRRSDNHQGIHDCAVVERAASHGKKVRYVLVVLGSYNQGLNPDPFDDLIRDLDALITT
jgi:hypothetical protein